METGQDKDGLLQEITVLDLADETASFCSRLLAHMGAFVIKVERPAGDPARNTGPFLEGSGESLSFLYHNTNKYGITLDLENRWGRETLLKLVEKSDVVLETFPPGYLDDRRLGYHHMHRVNPRVILTSVTGFGQHGPRRRFKSCDLVASALGGQMYVCGSPSTPPLKPFGEQPFYTASLFAVVAILLSLRKRSLSGEGEHLDLSVQEGVTATLEHVMIQYVHDHIVPQRQGRLHWRNAFYIFPCKEGFIHLALFQQWDTLVAWMDQEGMAGDLREEKYRDEQYRVGHLAHILAVMEKWTVTHEKGELFQLGQLMRFPWAPVFSPMEVASSPQLKAREFFVPVEACGAESTLRCPGLPFKLDPPLGGPVRWAPRVGEHNAKIHGELLGFNGAERERLAPVKVIEVPRGVARPHHATDHLAGKGIPTRPGFLNPLRVLDFTRVLAGPYVTRVLADFGAEVIKIQSKRAATGVESNTDAYFNTWNRNKMSMTLNMDYPEAKELVLRLTRVSDVVVENFSPRVMSNWGLDYPALRTVKADLVMLGMSAMGQTGPWRDHVGFGPTIQSASGLTFLTSFSQQSPLGMGYAHADLISGLYGAAAILAALERRDRTGHGMYIDLSEYEAMCSLMGPALMDVMVNQREVLPSGNHPGHLPGAPYGCYRCLGADRWCVIAVFNETEWQALCEAMGSPGWSKEERFSSFFRRRVHGEELNRLIARWTAGQEAEKVMEVLQGAGVSSGVVQDAEDLAKDPQLRARNFFVPLEHPLLGRTLTDSYPMGFREVRSESWKAAPLLGEHNRYVYRELLGLSEGEFEALVKKGVIG